MSYAIVGLGAGPAEVCNGGEVSEDGFGGRGESCCPYDTWSALTYKNVKGNTSWRRWREKLIRVALEDALASSDMGLPTKLHQMAFDSGLNEIAAVSPALVQKVSAALNNFRILYPLERWYKKPNCVRGDYDDGVCTGGDRKWNCWRSNPPSHTPQVAALLSVVAGTPISPAQLAIVREWDFVPPLTGGDSFMHLHKDEQRRWLQMPSAFATWAGDMHGVIVSCPGGVSQRMHSYRYPPTIEQLFVPAGGVIKPTAWMEKFLNLMTRKPIRLSRAAVGLRVAAPKKPDIRAAAATMRRVSPKPAASTQEEGAVSSPQSPPVAEPGGIDPKTLAIGGVVIVGLGFGAFVLLRKK